MNGTISERIQKVQENIEKAAVKCGRNSSDIKLMAVSKFHSIEEIEQAYNCGLKLYGENRVQEACEKFPEYHLSPPFPSASSPASAASGSAAVLPAFIRSPIRAVETPMMINRRIT